MFVNRNYFGNSYMPEYDTDHEASTRFGNQLREIGLIDNYEYSFFPYPAPNAAMLESVSSFGSSAKNACKAKKPAKKTSKKTTKKTSKKTSKKN